MLRGALLLLLLIAFPARADPGLTTAPYDPAARYRFVHVDPLAPELQPVFEAARREWVGVLKEKQTSDGRGWFLEQDQHTFLTLRSFASFTELDALIAYRRSIGDRVGEAAGKRYDAGDVALVPPHHSEIWTRDESVDYRAPGDTLSEYSAGYLAMRTDYVVDDAYAAAWKEIHAALTTAKYPLSRIGFYSGFGSGRLVTFWLARDKVAFRAAGTPEQAVARVLGKAPAAALFRRMRGGAAQSTQHEVVARPEFASPEATPAPVSVTRALVAHLGAIHRRDLPALMATVADDLVLVLPNGKILSGKPAYEAFHKEWFAERTWSMKLREVRRIETPELAVIFFQTEYKDVDAKGKPMQNRGLLVMVFRLIGGKWLLVHDQNTRV